MKKHLLYLLVLTMFGGTSACAAPSSATSAAAAETTAETTSEYAYDGLDDFWYTPQEFRGGITNYEALSPMASKDADMNKFIHSKLGEFTMNSRAILEYGSIDTPEWTEYWSEKGLVHEVHDADDEDHHWVSVMPKNVADTPDQKHPLLFVWHGNGNPLEIAETYGFIEPAAKKGWLVVLPWAANDDDYLTEFDRILNIIEETYPIDTSRIYTTGFSKGGRVSAHLALERADVLAAAAACATNTAAAFFTDSDEGELQLTGPQMLTDADFAQAADNVPIMFWGGEYDVYGAMPYDHEEKINALNNWLRLHKNESLQSLEESKKLIASGADTVEAAIGLTFDQKKIINSDGTTSYIGTYLDPDGKEAVQIILCKEAIHLSAPSTGPLAIEFLEQHSK